MNHFILSSAAWAARWLPMPVKRAIYQLKPLARWVRGGLNRAAPQGIMPVTVAAGGLAGLRLGLDLQTEKDYWLGTYEPELQAAVAALAQPGWVAYDVGANIGYITLLLAQAVGESGRVLAFEALPENLGRLRANLQMNDLASRVEVVAGAVVDRCGPVRFLVGPSGGMGKAEGSAGRQEVEYRQTLAVEGLSLDELVYERGYPVPRLVKIDIEGGEVLALPGMRRLLQDARPVLLLELHGPQAAQVAWDTLVESGYQLCQMQPGFPRITSQAGLGWKAYVVALPPE